MPAMSSVPAVRGWPAGASTRNSKLAATLYLAGATGLVGSQALALALADDRVKAVIAPTRRPIPEHPKLVTTVMDAARLQDDIARWAPDGAICALGTTRAKAGSAAAFRAIDHDLVIALATHLRDAGVGRFALTSSVGANAHSWFLYTRTKGEVEAAIGRLGFPSLTILRPGFLGGSRDENRPMERLMGRALQVASPLLPAAARISPSSTVARMLVEAAITGLPGQHVIGPAAIASAPYKPPARETVG